jgi:thiol-disulfide isomerase/thioredoxin
VEEAGRARPEDREGPGDGSGDARLEGGEGGAGDGSPEGQPTRRRYTLLQRLEPVLWLGLILFVIARFGPQFQAWTGFGPAPERSLPPELVLETLDGVRMGPEALEGKVRVVTFWATWCRVCRLELPSVQRLHERWEGSDQVVVVAISIDREGPAVVREHLEARGFTFPVAMAVPGTREAFGGIQGVPTTFIVGRDGRVHHVLVGVSGPATLARAVERLVEG